MNNDDLIRKDRDAWNWCNVPHVIAVKCCNDKDRMPIQQETPMVDWVIIACFAVAVMGFAAVLFFT